MREGVIKLCAIFLMSIVIVFKARGLSQEDLIDGVKLATIHELVEWTTNSDKIITF